MIARLKRGRALASGLTILGAALALGGCVRTPSVPRAPAIDPQIAKEVLASAAAQVRRCYRPPRVATVGKQIITKLEVRLNADGTLAGLPAVVAQSGVTPANRPYAGEMAEAATLAIIRCAPLRLPPEHYTLVWERFELSFSPSAVS